MMIVIPNNVIAVAKSTVDNRWLDILKVIYLLSDSSSVITSSIPNWWYGMLQNL